MGSFNVGAIVRFLRIKGGGGVGKEDEDKQMHNKAKVIHAQEMRSIMIGAGL